MIIFKYFEFKQEFYMRVEHFSPPVYSAISVRYRKIYQEVKDVIEEFRYRA